MSKKRLWYHIRYYLVFLYAGSVFLVWGFLVKDFQLVGTPAKLFTIILGLALFAACLGFLLKLEENRQTILKEEKLERRKRERENNKKGS
jgi:hypothetical protein